MAWCPDCRSFHFSKDGHYPLWETNVVSWPSQTNDDADWRPFRARTAEDAAILATEEYDSEEYSLLGGNHDVTVEVRASGNIEIIRFRCTGKSVPQYFAEEIK